MGTIARTTKAGGGTNFNSGQTINPTENNTDFNTVYTEINGLLDDANIETATIPGSKSLRFTEITAPSNPSANDALLYSVDRNSRTTLEYRDSAGNIMHLGGIISAHVRHSANQSIPDAADTAVALNTEDWDTAAMHDTVTNNSRVTVPIAGKYLVLANVAWATNATGIRRLTIGVNGTANQRVVELEGAAFDSSTATHQIAGVFNLAANDYVELIVQQTSGGALNVLATSPYTPSLTVQYVGN